MYGGYKRIPVIHAHSDYEGAARNLCRNSDEPDRSQISMYVYLINEG